MPLPQRQPTRLPGFDYGTPGAYFVTVCVKDRQNILSIIDKIEGNPPTVRLLPCGLIAEKHIRSIGNHFKRVQIDHYVIMPDHIHMMIVLEGSARGASPSPTVEVVSERPTVPRIMGVLKSLIAKECKKTQAVEQLFQRSYMDHIIRDKEDYQTRVRYISENPSRWYYSH